MKGWRGLLVLVVLAGQAAVPLHAEAPAAAQVKYPAYHGPKKTVAVTKFDATGAFVGEYGGWDIGGGLAAMLAAELARTNRFVVVDRADLDIMLREKRMALSDVSQGTSGRPILGAQTFIRGSVTQFDQQEKGGGLSIGVNVGGRSGGASRRQASGQVTIELRLIDGETGAILSTSRVDKKVKSSSVALKGKSGIVAFGGDQFHNTALGTASRDAIAEAVAQIVAQMENVPFQALVAKTEGPRVFLNAGSNANLAVGNRMRVTRMVDKVSDPQTGELLGGRKITLCELVVVRVEEKFAITRMEAGGTLPAVGDVASLLGP